MSLFPERRRKQAIAYLIGLAVTTIVFVYILDIPNRMTGEGKLVKEYYYDNAIQSFILDIFIMGAYLGAANWVLSKLPFKGLAAQTLTVAGTSALISSAFMFYFLKQPKNASFFAKWFHAVGFTAVIYDAILVSGVFLATKAVRDRL